LDGAKKRLAGTEVSERTRGYCRFDAMCFVSQRNSIEEYKLGLDMAQAAA
jgi:hypothetical protein